MMVDRRTLTAATVVTVVVVVGVIAGRALVGDGAAPGQATGAGPVKVDSPSAPAAQPPVPATPATHVATTIPTLEPDVAAPRSSTVEPVAGSLTELVAAARPTLPTSMFDDRHEHHQRRSGEADVDTIAAALVVGLWSWRFDDEPDRHYDLLTALVDPGLVDELAPNADHLAARTARAEVSWVIISQVDTAAGSDSATDIANVTFDQHLVTAAAAETVTRRVATVAIDDGTVTALDVTSDHAAVG